MHKLEQPKLEELTKFGRNPLLCDALAMLVALDKKSILKSTKYRVGIISNYVKYNKINNIF